MNCCKSLLFQLIIYSSEQKTRLWSLEEREKRHKGEYLIRFRLESFFLVVSGRLTRLFGNPNSTNLLLLSSDWICAAVEVSSDLGSV
ncbi:hypothetical protein SDJN02_04850, partial [Cucurbita argyrosperma subsp. argyrosperma]